MSDTNPSQTEPKLWRPGDVANGHRLDQDGVWRPIGQPAPKPMSTNQKVGWIMAGVLVLAVGIASIASIGSDTSGTQAGSGSSATSGGSAVDPDAAFTLVMAQNADLTDRIADEAGKFSEAAASYDISGAVEHAENAADAADEIVARLSQHAETQASQLGRDTVAAFQGCSSAYTDSADSLRTLDADAMSAATAEIQTCTSDINDLTARMAG